MDSLAVYLLTATILTRTKPEVTEMERSKAFKARLEYERNCEAKYDRHGRPSILPPEGERMMDYAMKYGCTRDEMIDVLPEVERYMKSCI